MSRFTNREKMDEACRELAMRKRHYPGMIARGSLSHEIAHKRQLIMQEMAEEYEERAKQDELPLVTK